MPPAEAFSFAIMSILHMVSTQLFTFCRNKSHEIYTQGQGPQKAGQAGFWSLPLVQFWSYAPWFAEKFQLTLDGSEGIHVLCTHSSIFGKCSF